MAEIDELDPQQYQRQYWEDDVPLNDVRESTLRRLVYYAAGLFALFLLAGLFIKFPDEVQLPFVFKSDKSEDIYRFPYPVYLADNYMTTGRVVKKGVRMLRITSPEIVVLIGSYNEAAQNFANYKNQKTLSLDKQREIINIHILEDSMKIQQSDKELAALESTWKSNRERLQFEKEDAESKLVQNKQLHEGKYISAMELKQFETRKMSAVDAAVTGRQNYEKDKAGILSLRSQYTLDIASQGQELNKLSLDTKYDSVQLTNQLELATNRIKNTFGDFEIDSAGLVLKANADGMVSFLFEGDKEIPAGAILLKTKYNNTSLYSTIVSPPSLVGKLKNKQSVFLKVATFPSYEFGAVRGHVDNISLTPDEKGSFNVRVGLDDLRDLKNSLQPGMNGNATIVLDERTFFQYFFRNVKKSYSDLTQNN